MLRIAALIFGLAAVLQGVQWLYAYGSIIAFNQNAQVCPAVVLSLEEVWSKNRSSRWGELRLRYFLPNGDSLEMNYNCRFEPRCGEFLCPAEVGDSLRILYLPWQQRPRTHHYCVSEFQGLVLAIGLGFFALLFAWLGGGIWPWRRD